MLPGLNRYGSSGHHPSPLIDACGTTDRLAGRRSRKIPYGGSRSTRHGQPPPAQRIPADGGAPHGGHRGSPARLADTDIRDRRVQRHPPLRRAAATAWHGQAHPGRRHRACTPARSVTSPLRQTTLHGPSGPADNASRATTRPPVLSPAVIGSPRHSNVTPRSGQQAPAPSSNANSRDPPFTYHLIRAAPPAKPAPDSQPSGNRLRHDRSHRTGCVRATFGTPHLPRRRSSSRTRCRCGTRRPETRASAPAPSAESPRFAVGGPEYGPRDPPRTP